MLRLLAIVVGAAILCGCAADKTPEQLHAASIGLVCGPWNSDYPNVQAERVRRGLSDCSTEDQICVDRGFRSGTQAYNDCRYGTPQRQMASFESQCANAVASAESYPGPLGAPWRATASYCQQHGYYVPPQALAPPRGYTTHCTRELDGSVNCTTQ